MKRLTAKQVVDHVEELILGNTPRDEYDKGYHDAIDRAVEILNEQIVPRWQDEPDADGWYWVEGYEGPRFVQFIHRWMHGDDQFMAYEIPIESRRVCPIGERPEDGA